MSDQDLREKEADAVLGDTAKDFSPEEQAEYGKLGGDDGFYTGSDTPRKKRHFTRQQKAAIGSGIALTGAIGMFSFLSGPLQFVHKAQLFQKFHFSAQDHFGDDRSAKFVYYMVMGKAQRGRLGIISNRVADKWETRLNERSGLKSVYSQTTGRLTGYEIIDADKAGSFIADMESEGIPRTNSLGGRSGDFIDFSDARFRGRRSIVRTATRSIGINKIQSSLGSRLHIKRAGVNFHPLSRAKQAVDDFLERRRQLREDYDNSIETGDPNAPDPPSLGTRNSILEKLRSFANSAKGPAAVAAVVCGIKSFSDSIDAQNYENTQQLVRMGMGAVIVGNQVMSNKDMDMEMLSALSETNYDEKTGTTWSEDPGIQQESGQEPTGKDYNEDVKPGSNQKPVIFDVVDRVPTSFFGLNVCGAIEAASNAPGVKQASEAFNDALNGILASVGIASPDELTERAIDYFSSGGVDVLAEGAERGGLENIGNRLAARDLFIANGGRELSKSEETNVKRVVNAEQEQQFARAGVFEKYFNIMDSQSAVAKAYIAAPKNAQQMATSLVNLPRAFGSITLSLLGRQRASAATTYDYGFPLYGFSITEQENTDYDNGFANADYIETPGKLEQLNSDYGDKCFGMTISRSGDLVYNAAPDASKIPSECSNTSNQDLVRYRFYIADMITAHTLACYEGEEDSCNQLGFGALTTSAGPGGLGVSPDGFTFPLRTTKNIIINNAASRWCYQSQDNCHHDYNAADIFAPTGTSVVVARSGVVLSAKDNDSSSVGSRVTIKGEDGNLYYYAHMGNGTIRVKTGDTVTAGQEIGRVGTRADAVGTDMHLHFDIMPPPTESRPSCSGAECSNYPFINPQPVLVQSFGALP